MQKESIPSSVSKETHRISLPLDIIDDDCDSNIGVMSFETDQSPFRCEHRRDDRQEILPVKLRQNYGFDYTSFSNVMLNEGNEGHFILKHAENEALDQKIEIIVEDEDPDWIEVDWVGLPRNFELSLMSRFDVETISKAPLATLNLMLDELKCDMRGHRDVEEIKRLGNSVLKCKKTNPGRIYRTI